MITLNAIADQAVAMGATDIHLFNQKEGGVLRFRVHGALGHPAPIRKLDATSFISSIKIQSGMDISKTTPQDGLIEYKDGIRLRISTLPTPHGEDCAIRILPLQPATQSISDLGYDPLIVDELREWAFLDSGLILITGATGSGKSTTIYSLIREVMKDTSRCVVTLENPVEYVIDGARQSQINYAAGYSFSVGLRAVLRQDPDVIVIGEIRDQETAITALEAAYTGHLVIASLHTIDIDRTLSRLAQFQLDPFWVSQSIQGILSQQLVPIVDPSGARIGRKLSAELVSLRLTSDRTALLEGRIPVDAIRITRPQIPTTRSK